MMAQNRRSVPEQENWQKKYSEITKSTLVSKGSLQAQRFYQLPQLASCGLLQRDALSFLSEPHRKHRQLLCMGYCHHSHSSCSWFQLGSLMPSPTLQQESTFCLRASQDCFHSIRSSCFLLLHCNGKKAIHYLSFDDDKPFLSNDNFLALLPHHRNWRNEKWHK